MQIEDPIDPSCRLKGMSWDFTYLIEDPITDIQLFPAQIMRLSKPRAYLESYWSDLKPQKHFVAGLFYPKLFKGIGVGAMYNYYFEKFSFGDSGNLGVQKFQYSKQHPSLFSGIPFLKDGGLLAFQLSYIYAQDHFSHLNYDHIDSLAVYYGDTLISHWNYSSSYYDKQTIPQWRFKLDQFLPFDSVSSMDIVLEFCPYREHKNYFDTILEYQLDTTITHGGAARTVQTVESNDMDYSTTVTDKFLPSGNLIFLYRDQAAWGKLRFLGRLGLAKGRYENRRDNISNSVFIIKDDFYYPDTNYAYADTVVSIDTNFYMYHDNNFYFNAMLGGGGYIRGKKENVLLGVKLSYSLEQINQPQDTFYIKNQSYCSSASIGVEWYVSKFLCLRDGLNMTLQYNIGNIQHGINYFEDSGIYFSEEAAFGFGVKPVSHFQLDFYTRLNIDEIFDIWAIDAVYDF